MYLPDFDYYRPASIDEACELMARLGPKAKVLAGGTDVLPKMKNEMMAPEALVSLKDIEGLETIRYQGRDMVIGSRVTPNELVHSIVLKERYLSVSEAAASMANHQIRNRGTVGGNIVNAVPSADLPPILIALGAAVILVSVNGKRTVSLEEFITGPCQTTIAYDEILTEVVIPDQSTNGSSYYKFGLRHSGSLAVVGVAATATVKEGMIESVRIVMGAVAPRPMRAREAERIVAGRAVTEALLEEAGQAAAGECQPISDIRGSAEYRRDMVRVFTKRALKKAVQRGTSGEKGEPVDASH